MKVRNDLTMITCVNDAVDIWPPLSNPGKTGHENENNEVSVLNHPLWRALANDFACSPA